jgi:hypothetical protein
MCNELSEALFKQLKCKLLEEDNDNEAKTRRALFFRKPEYHREEVP